MILPIALLFAASTPEETLARSMETYTLCLREAAGPSPLTRERAVERARLAIANCQNPRIATVLLAVELLTPQLGASEAEDRIEQALEDVEAVFPITLEGPVEVVPQTECPSGLKVNNRCYE